MKEVNLRLSVNVSGGKIWEVLADFRGFLKWAGGETDQITIEGDGVGMIRHLKMSGSELGERLTILEPSKKILGYELVYGEPLGMKQYSAIVQVVDLMPTSEIVWKGKFDTGYPESEDEVGVALTAAYEGMTSALVSYLDG